MSTLERRLPYQNMYGTVDISGTDNVRDALDRAGLNWRVVQKEIYDEHGNPYPKYAVNVRDIDNKMLGMVTHSYKIVQNEDAFNFVDNLVDEGFEFDSAGEFRGGSSIWVMGQLPKTEILGDDISNNVVFVNSHDGSSGVKVMMTPVRLICSNMLNLATRKADRTWTARHTKRIESRLEEAKYTLGLANNYIKALNDEAERLALIKISDAELEAVFDSLFPVDKNKDSERKIKNVSIMKNNLFRCYNEADIKQFKGTAWGVINAVADMVDHSAPLRNSDNYFENSWSKLISGHPVLDKMYASIR